MIRYEVSFKGAYIGKILNHDKWIVFPWEWATVQILQQDV
jgi:hypothetical protein